MHAASDTCARRPHAGRERTCSGACSIAATEERKMGRVKSSPPRAARCEYEAMPLPIMSQKRAGRGSRSCVELVHSDRSATPS